MLRPTLRSPLLRTLGAAATLLLAASPTRAQEIPAAPLPVDPGVTVGTLENGVTYYIRSNSRPEARAELRLVVNAGSVLEDETQRGLAHLLEHMAFNGTENFEKQELVDYLESIGMEFGPSVNAYTSFDETVYMLQVPTDDPEAFATSFQILEDWAHQLTLDPEEIDAERGVVMEEWRLGRGAAARIRDQQFPIMFRDSRYADRLPIGTVEVLQSFPHEELERFYRQWYRPDLMAVVAVGDFDPAEVEERIRTHFGRIPASDIPTNRPYFGVPDHEDTYYAIAGDPEASAATVGILTMQEPREVETLVDYRRSLVEQLASRMLNGRLDERTQQADPPFVAAFTGRGSFVRTRSAFQLLALVQEDGHERGFRALLEEAERAARHGFTPGELEREKLDLARALERQYAERENQESARYASEYVSHYLQGTPIPGIEFEYQAGQALMQTIGVEDVNAVARENLDPANRIVLADGVERPDLPLPTTEELGGILETVAATDLAPYEDTALDQPLVAEAPAPGSIVGERELPEVGVTEWRLSNGATVWVKPTDFKDDEVVLRASSYGGWSRSSLEDHTSATNAAAVVQMGGVGAFSRIELQKALAGKSVSLSPGIGESEEFLTGAGSPQDLETLLQLVWLHFTAPREDSTAFAAMQAQMRAFLANRDANPMAAFGDTITAVMTQHHPRARPPSMAMLEELELGTAVDFYRDRFADASDFHFTLVGALEPATLRPLVERWIASLPAVEREDDWVDLDMDPPTGRVEKVVRAGVEPQSQTRIAFTGPFEYTPENRLRIRALASVLETRLRERLREDLGGTYSVGVNGGYDDIPEERYTFQIQFGADPERAAELREVVFQEIARFKAEGATDLDVQKAVESERRGWETNLRVNQWWAAQLDFVAMDGSDPSFLLDEGRFQWINAANLREDAGRWLDPANVVVVTLLPEVPVGQ